MSEASVFLFYSCFKGGPDLRTPALRDLSSVKKLKIFGLSLLYIVPTIFLTSAGTAAALTAPFEGHDPREMFAKYQRWLRKIWDHWMIEAGIVEK